DVDFPERSQSACRNSGKCRRLEAIPGAYRSGVFRGNGFPCPGWESTVLGMGEADPGPTARGRRLDGPLMANGPQDEHRLHGLAPEGRFVAVEALERAVVQVGEAEEAVGQ